MKDEETLCPFILEIGKDQKRFKKNIRQEKGKENNTKMKITTTIV